MRAARVALVTGANRGIGFESCRQLARRGLRVLLSGRNEQTVRAAADALDAEGARVTPLVLDVGDPASIRSAAEAVLAEHGRLDVLVNNAGILPDRRLGTLDVPIEMVRETFETHVFGPLQLCQAFVPSMRKNGYGRIVNLASRLASLAEMGGGHPAYRASKTALVALTRVLAAELDDSNVLVNAVCPGWVKTAMGGPRATREVEDATDTIVWLATLPDDGPTGGFFQDREPVPW
jgi:NAD(P)-dependent dehydrogenase (short-subunit alcohol dehydrogenase family)